MNNKWLENLANLAEAAEKELENMQDAPKSIVMLIGYAGSARTFLTLQNGKSTTYRDPDPVN